MRAAPLDLSSLLVGLALASLSRALCLVLPAQPSNTGAQKTAPITAKLPAGAPSPGRQREKQELVSDQSDTGPVASMSCWGNLFDKSGHRNTFSDDCDDY